MRSDAISKLLLVFCLISLIMAVYQIADSRILDGILSLVFSSVFLIGGIANRNKGKVEQ